MHEISPLSHVSMVARTSLCWSMSAASLNNRSPRSVPDISRHEGSLKAVRAAITALSTSSAEAAYTEVISLSSLSKSQSFTASHSSVEDLCSPRIDAGNLLVIARLHPLIVDKQTNRLSVLLAIRRRKLHGQVGHPCGLSKPTS